MQRIVATLPEEVEELCLIRLGFQVHRARSIFQARRIARQIDRAAVEAITGNAGLLHSESFLMAWNHFGVLQYWRSFAELERWSHQPPHSDWWRALTDRLRTRDDLGVYHETFAVPRSHIESIYLNCRPAGLGTFGIRGEPTGGMTAARDRLGRRVPKGV